MQTQLKLMKSLPALPVDVRISRLKQLAQIIKANQNKIIEAIQLDFSHRCTQESQMAEIMVCIDEIKHALKHIKQWTQSKTWMANWKFYPSKCSVSPQAKGVVGIMAPWNYPFNLVIEPLVAAIAAGNRVLVKPSEITANTANMTKDLLAQVFTKDEVFVVLGDAQVANEFSQLPLDHILFTGSTHVGKIIMKNASEHLVPLTLELGGKSPVLIDESYPIKQAAKSIVQGKWFNAGQTCIAPDYLIVSEKIKQPLLDAIKSQVDISYPNIYENEDYSAIVNDNHLTRIKQLLEDLDASQIITIGSSKNKPKGRKIPPTLVLNPPHNHPLMSEEIFGPILPIISTPSLEDAIKYINSQPNPLTLYLFSNNKKVIKKIRRQTKSGSLAINETLVHFAQEGLPFGGIGASGMGSYHGYQGFLAMSHMKSVYYQSRINLNNLVRAPYTFFKKKILALINR